ncbi:MAG: hypothetical protein LBE04_04375 [Prevotellaceae bacterium]|jgi:hypothetical protein|nr:hypothetical protein [Prevotellaceae bacterium]
MKHNNIIKKIQRELMRHIYLYSGIYISVQGSFSFFKYFKLRKQLRLLTKQQISSSTPFPVEKLQAHYEDKCENAAIFGFYYFYQDLYVAHKIHQNHPEKHIDIGSSISGFAAHVASYREIEVHDIRPLEKNIHNIKFKQCDLMKLNSDNIEYTDSISCLHALEHFGLGRYGDRICYDGY